MRTLVLMMLIGCGTPSPSDTTATTATPSSAATSTATTPDGVTSPLPGPPIPRPDGETCLQMQRAFQAKVDAASGTCTVDAECGCYGGLAPGLGCGGVTDYASSTALAGLERQFDGGRCKRPIACESAPCLATCVDGRCVPKPADPRSP